MRRGGGWQSSGEVAELLGVTPRTVHYYEEQGLVTPERTDEGTRFCSDFDVRRLEVCVRLAELGVPIRTIARLAQIRKEAATGEATSRALVEVFAGMRSTFRERLARLRYVLGDLEKIERLVRGCWTCPNKPNPATARASASSTRRSSSASRGTPTVPMTSWRAEDRPCAGRPAGPRPCRPHVRRLNSPPRSTRTQCRNGSAHGGEDPLAQGGLAELGRLIRPARAWGGREVTALIAPGSSVTGSRLARAWVDDARERGGRITEVLVRHGGFEAGGC